MKTFMQDPIFLQALIKYIKTLKIPGAILIFLPGWNLIFALHRYLETHPEFGRAAYYWYCVMVFFMTLMHIFWAFLLALDILIIDLYHYKYYQVYSFIRNVTSFEES